MSNVIKNYQRASILFFIYILIIIVRLIYTQVYLQDSYPFQLKEFVFVIAMLILLVMLAAKIWSGSRWARIVFFVLGAFWVLSIPKSLLQDFDQAITLGVLGVLEAVLLLLALVLLINVEMKIWRRKQ